MIVNCMLKRNQLMGWVSTELLSNIDVVVLVNVITVVTVVVYSFFL